MGEGTGMGCERVGWALRRVGSHGHVRYDEAGEIH